MRLQNNNYIMMQMGMSMMTMPTVCVALPALCVKRLRMPLALIAA